MSCQKKETPMSQRVTQWEIRLQLVSSLPLKREEFKKKYLKSIPLHDYWSKTLYLSFSSHLLGVSL